MFAILIIIAGPKFMNSYFISFLLFLWWWVFLAELIFGGSM